MCYTRRTRAVPPTLRALRGKLEDTQESRDVFDGSDEGDVGDANVGRRRVEDRLPRRTGHKSLRGNPPVEKR